MAEPVSALPNPTTPKGEPVPWPAPAAPLPVSPEISGSNTETAVSDFSDRLHTGFQEYYSRLQTAVSNILKRSRQRFRDTAQERPMQIVIGVAVASLLAGAALRIWRSHHD